MLYAKHASELDPKRAERFRNRAKKFAHTFWAYFDTNGTKYLIRLSLFERF